MICETGSRRRLVKAKRYPLKGSCARTLRTTPPSVPKDFRRSVATAARNTRVEDRKFSIPQGPPPYVAASMLPSTREPAPATRLHSNRHQLRDPPVASAHPSPDSRPMDPMPLGELPQRTSRSLVLRTQSHHLLRAPSLPTLRENQPLTLPFADADRNMGLAARLWKAFWHIGRPN